MNIGIYANPKMKARLKKTIIKQQEAAEDKNVDDMLRDWDKVTCHYCGKEISMLNGKMINNGQYFVCKNH